MPSLRVIWTRIVWKCVVSFVFAFFLDLNLLECHELASILKEKDRYNKDKTPTSEEGKPTVIIIQMYIEGMSSFRAQSMDFHLDIYLQEKWVDERLRHNSTKRILLKNPSLLKQIWHPDLYFANARTAEFHDVTSPNFLVWIYPNGTIWYDLRDAYDTEQLVIKWANESWNTPIDTNPEITLPDMRLRKITPGLRNDTYATGVWSCATAEFVVDRHLMHHLIQSYLPCSLIVIISWFSFWLDVESVPGRVSLSITTLLTLATQNSAERMSLPQSSYVKASDVFGGACMAFVFSAMIEFTVVNYFTRRKPRRLRKSKWRKYTSEPQQYSSIGEHQLDPSNLLSNEHIYFKMQRKSLEEDERHKVVWLKKSEKPSNQLKCSKAKGKKENRQSLFKRSCRKNKNLDSALHQQLTLANIEINRKAAQKIDQKCRIYFPTAFFIFNLLYWIYYLIIATDEL